MKEIPLGDLPYNTLVQDILVNPEKLLFFLSRISRACLHFKVPFRLDVILPILLAVSQAQSAPTVQELVRVSISESRTTLFSLAGGDSSLFGGSSTESLQGGAEQLQGSGENVQGSAEHLQGGAVRDFWTYVLFLPLMFLVTLIPTANAIDFAAYAAQLREEAAPELGIDVNTMKIAEIQDLRLQKFLKSRFLEPFTDRRCIDMNVAPVGFDDGFEQKCGGQLQDEYDQAQFALAQEALVQPLTGDEPLRRNEETNKLEYYKDGEWRTNFDELFFKGVEVSASDPMVSSRILLKDIYMNAVRDNLDRSNQISTRLAEFCVRSESESRREELKNAILTAKTATQRAELYRSLQACRYANVFLNYVRNVLQWGVLETTQLSLLPENVFGDLVLIGFQPEPQPETSTLSKIASAVTNAVSSALSTDVQKAEFIAALTVAPQTMSITYAPYPASDLFFFARAYEQFSDASPDQILALTRRTRAQLPELQPSSALVVSRAISKAVLETATESFDPSFLQSLGSYLVGSSALFLTMTKVSRALQRVVGDTTTSNEDIVNQDLPVVLETIRDEYVKRKFLRRAEEEEVKELLTRILAEYLHSTSDSVPFLQEFVRKCSVSRISRLRDASRRLATIVTGRAFVERARVQRQLFDTRPRVPDRPIMGGKSFDVTSDLEGGEVYSKFWTANISRREQFANKFGYQATGLVFAAKYKNALEAILTGRAFAMYANAADILDAMLDYMYRALPRYLSGVRVTNGRRTILTRAQARSRYDQVRPRLIQDFNAVLEILGYEQLADRFVPVFDPDAMTEGDVQDPELLAEPFAAWADNFSRLQYPLPTYLCTVIQRFAEQLESGQSPFDYALLGGDKISLLSRCVRTTPPIQDIPLERGVSSEEEIQETFAELRRRTRIREEERIRQERLERERLEQEYPIPRAIPVARPITPPESIAELPVAQQVIDLTDELPVYPQTPEELPVELPVAPGATARLYPQIPEEIPLQPLAVPVLYIPEWEREGFPSESTARAHNALLILDDAIQEIEQAPPQQEMGVIEILEQPPINVEEVPVLIPEGIATMEQRPEASEPPVEFMTETTTSRFLPTAEELANSSLPLGLKVALQQVMMMATLCQCEGLQEALGGLWIQIQADQLSSDQIPTYVEIPPVVPATVLGREQDTTLPSAPGPSSGKDKKEEPPPPPPDLPGVVVATPVPPPKVELNRRLLYSNWIREFYGEVMRMDGGSTGNGQFHFVPRTFSVLPANSIPRIPFSRKFLTLREYIDLAPAFPNEITAEITRAILFQLIWTFGAMQALWRGFQYNNILDGVQLIHYGSARCFLIDNADRKQQFCIPAGMPLPILTGLSSCNGLEEPSKSYLPRRYGTDLDKSNDVRALLDGFVGSENTIFRTLDAFKPALELDKDCEQDCDPSALVLSDVFSTYREHLVYTSARAQVTSLN